VDAPRQDELIRLIVDRFSKKDIQSFVFESFGFLHQHVFVFDSNVPILKVSLGKISNFKTITTVNGIEYFNYLFEIKYDYFSPRLNGKDELIFHCPIRITLYRDKLILMINTIERNITNYFKTPIYSLGKNIDENDIINTIKQDLPKGTSLITTDLNKGVKKLWNDDFIDAIYSRYKRTKSTSTEVMDEDNLLKFTYPDRYKEIVKAPIDKTIFLVIANNVKDIVYRFSIEPRMGKTSITRFSDGLNDIDNLIKKIIDNN
tara:strand:- start:6804 stop:7583 length:780 start_codon:yes stop_codon:yes gene_type:complete